MRLDVGALSLPHATRGVRARVSGSSPYLLLLFAVVVLVTREPLVADALREVLPTLPYGVEMSVWAAALPVGIALLVAVLCTPRLRFQACRAWIALGVVVVGVVLAMAPVGGIVRFIELPQRHVWTVGAPFVLCAAYGLAAVASVRRDLLVTVACVAFVVVGAHFAARGPSFTLLIDGPSLGGEYGIDGCLHSITRAGPLVFATLAMGICAIERRGLGRWAFAALAAGLAFAAARDLVAVAAAAVLRVAHPFRMPSEARADLDVAAIERLARIGEVSDVVLAAAVGCCAAAFVTHLFARPRRGAFALAGPLSVAAVVLLWATSHVSQPPVWKYSTFQIAQPIWPTVEIDPLIVPGPAWTVEPFDSRPALSGQTWIVDRGGDIIEASGPVSADGRYDTVELAPDRRASLRDVLEASRAVGARWVSVIGRTPRSVELDRATRARKRFPFVEYGTQSVSGVDVEYADDHGLEEIVGFRRTVERLGAAEPCVATVTFKRDRPAHRCPDGRPRILVLRDIPPEVTVGALVPLAGEQIVMHTASGVPLDMMRRGPSARWRLTPSRESPSPPYPIAAVAFLLSLLAAAVYAWRRWRARARVGERIATRDIRSDAGCTSRVLSTAVIVRTRSGLRMLLRTPALIFSICIGIALALLHFAGA